MILANKDRSCKRPPDRPAREAVKANEPALEELIKAFGKEILREDRTLDRRWMLDIILNDTKARRLVEGIIHPLKP